EHGLTPSDLASPKRVTRADVVRHLEQQQPNAVAPLSSMRRAIAEHMVHAYQSIPMGQTVMHADLTNLAAWREREKTDFERENKAPLTYTVLFVHALARALSRIRKPVDI